MPDYFSNTRDNHSLIYFGAKKKQFRSIKKTQSGMWGIIQMNYPRQDDSHDFYSQAVVMILILRQ